MTARRFNACCPDCNRWRCICEAEDAIEAPAGDLAPFLHPLWQAEPVRTGPPPAPIRERLAKLRAEIAAHLCPGCKEEAPYCGCVADGVTGTQAPDLTWMVPAMREMAKGLPNNKADALLKWASAIERAAGVKEDGNA